MKRVFGFLRRIATGAASNQLRADADDGPIDASPIAQIRSDGPIPPDGSRLALPVSEGSPDAPTLPHGTPLTGGGSGPVFAFIAGAENAGATTLTAGEVGEVAVRRGGHALAGGELRTGEIAFVGYDGRHFQLHGPWARFPTAGEGSTNTIIGVSAGLGMSPEAVEVTAVGHYAGGSNGNGVNKLGGGTGLTGAQNTFVGWLAGTQATTANFSVAVGNNAMGHETTGASLVAVGADAMRNSQGVVGSVAVGTNAMYYNNGGAFNVAIGAEALNGAGQASATGSSNTAVGYQAIGGGVAESASANTAIGDSAGRSLTEGSSNTLIGCHAGFALTSGFQNVGMGYDSLSTATTASGNVAVGAMALKGMTSGIDNTAIGQLAGENIAGSGNTIIGAHTAPKAATGDRNTIIGFGAAAALATGADNVVIGANVGSTMLASGSGNVLIGPDARTDAPLPNTSHYLNLAGVLHASNIGDPGHSDVLMNSRSITILPSRISVPSAPATGFTLFVDVSDNKLKAISPNGTITTLASA